MGQERNHGSTVTRRVIARGPMSHQSICKEQHRLKTISAVEKSVGIELTSLSNPKSPTGTAKSPSPTSRAEPKKFRRSQAGDARLDERDLNGSHSFGVSGDIKAVSEGDSVESNTSEDAVQAKMSWHDVDQKKPVNPRK
jgi:hypothetical protein